MELRVKPLAPNQSLSASSLFFLCFSTIVEVKFAFSLLYSPLRTSPPPHPLPSTKQRKSAPSDSYTNSSDTKDQEVERKGGRGYLEPNSPMMQPMRALTLPLRHLFFGTKCKIYHFFRTVQF